jgi:chondroitin sulfate synthase
MEEVNKISRTMGRFLEYKKTLYGYYKYEPRYGMNYILDLFLIYRKYMGKNSSSYSSALLSHVEAGSPSFVNSTAPMISNSNMNLILPSSSIPIHMIVPVSGRLLTLRRLLTNFLKIHCSFFAL